VCGREAVEARETELSAGGARHEIAASIERIGLESQIATRLTSWIAVSDDVTVDPRAPHRRERMPHQVPHGVSAEGLGLRACAMPLSAPTSAFAAFDAELHETTDTGYVAASG